MLIPLYCNVEETNTVGDTIITLIPEHVQGIFIEIVLLMNRPDVDTAVLQCGRNNTVGDTIITLIPEHVQGISIEIVLVMNRSDVDSAVL